MTATELTRSRLAVLLFSDIVASGKLKAQLGVAEYARALQRHNEIFENICRDLHGEILKHTGDGFFVAFDTSSHAVRAALRFQYALRSERWKQPLSVRVGIHQGEVAVVEMAGRPDVVGVAADVASRVMALACGGQILLTRAAFNDARQFVSEHPALNGKAVVPALRWMAHGPYLCKGLEEPVEVFEVGADGAAPLSAPAGGEVGKRVVPHDQEPTLGWRPAAGLAVPSRTGWTLERKLGEGGFGEVWLGHHDQTQSRRVFKFCFSAEHLRSFKRELTLFRLLRDALGDRHDIARLHEVKLDEPPYFLESEWTESGNLIDWAQAQDGLRAVALHERIEIVAKIADAVEAAHSVGILHKDIKPANVLVHVERDGTVQPRLSDFGIGMLADRSQLSSRHITTSGFTDAAVSESTTGGTQMYMPPELLAGKPFTTRGDIYSLGVVLYQVVVGDLGHPLAVGWERDVADELLREDIAACVEGDPQRRLATAVEMSQRLRSLTQRRAERVQATQAQAMARRRRLIFRSAVAISLVLAVIAALAVFALVRERQLRTQLAQSERSARERLLSSLIFSGESLLKSQESARARRTFAEARDLAEGLGASQNAALCGMLMACAASPPPLLGSDGNDAGAGGLKGHDGFIFFIEFSADGRVAYTMGADLKLRSWDMMTGAELSSNPVDVEMHHAAMFPDSKRMLTCGDDGTIRIINRDGRTLKSAVASTQPVRGVGISSDGKLGLSASFDRLVKLWELPALREVRTFAGHVEYAHHAVFTPDARKAISCSENGEVRVWDVTSGQAMAAFLAHADSAVTSLVMSPDGRTFVTGSVDKMIKVWDVKTLTGMTLAGHTGAVRDVAFSPDGRQIASASSDGSVRVWDATSGRELMNFTGHLRQPSVVRFTPDGRAVMSASADGQLKLWTLDLSAEVPRFSGHTDRVVSAAFSADGRLALTGSFDRSAKLWDVATGKTLRTISNVVGKIWSVALSADAKLALAGGEANEMVLLDVANGAVVRRFEGHTDLLTAVAFLPDGRRAVSASSDQTLRVWDLTTGQTLYTLKGHTARVRAVAVSPDGSKILSGSFDGTVKLWSAETGQEIRAFHGHVHYVSAVCFSPDGTRALSGSWDQTLRLWDVNTGDELARFTGNAAWVLSAAFSPNMQMAVSGGYDQTVRLWDLRTAEQIACFTDHNDAVTAVAFSPDARIVMSVSRDSTVRLRDILRPLEYRRHSAALASAREALAHNANDVAAKAAFGSWYAFRGANERAVEMLEAARTNGAAVSSLMLARCYWKLDRLAQAQQEFEVARQKQEAPAAYIDLCLRAIREPAATNPATIPAATNPATKAAAGIVPAPPAPARSEAL